MENQDKLYEQFQQASQKAETKDFPGMDKLWARVEDKLDHKVLKNENKLWKKIAIAASFLLLFTVGYELSKENEEVVTPVNPVVNSEIEPIKEDAIVLEKQDEITAPLPLVSPKQAEKIIQEKIKPQDGVSVVEDAAPKAEESFATSANAFKKESEEKNSGYFETQKFNARSVQNNLVAKEVQDTVRPKRAVIKQDPLFVVNGKALTPIESETLLRSKAVADDIQTMDILAEPLYIINGVEYTETELFGPNPTSPYFPLNQQEITSTTVYQGESATTLYGEKGKKGVVVITTKNGKPVEK
ncbi:hypothetical protein ACI6PS_06120 [Flavobacterium sp. PLA-1-15]|uniref:hypothetical protein n=1 Tax=Flavobacterium sp. PLA-1-15 TaxID=3380533 RepID=UPI003B8281B6